MKFTQRRTQYIQTPALIKPFHLDSAIKEIGIELDFNYTETSFAATITVDVSSLFGSVNKLVFNIASDETLHYSITTMFRNPKYAPLHQFEDLADMLSGYSLSDIVTNLSFKIGEQFVDKMFDNPVYDPEKPAVVAEYAPQYRKGVALTVTNTIRQLVNFMPSYEGAYKL